MLASREQVKMFFKCYELFHWVALGRCIVMEIVDLTIFHENYFIMTLLNDVLYGMLV